MNKSYYRAYQIKAKHLGLTDKTASNEINMIRYLQMQQTPNPLAHVPEEVPPLLSHSAAVMINRSELVLVGPRNREGELKFSIIPLLS